MNTVELKAMGKKVQERCMVDLYSTLSYKGAETGRHERLNLVMLSTLCGTLKFGLAVFGCQLNQPRVYMPVVYQPAFS